MNPIIQEKICAACPWHTRVECVCFFTRCVWVQMGEVIYKGEHSYTTYMDRVTGNIVTVKMRWYGNGAEADA